MPRGDVYTLIHKRIVVATAITILQVKAGTLNGFDIVRAWISQRGSTTSAQEQISLVRKSAAATVTTAAVGTHLMKHKTGQPTPNLSLGVSATGVTGTAEGTDSDEVWSDSFNVLNGLLYLPVPEERIHCDASEIIAMKFMVAPASQTWFAGITIIET